MEKRWESKAISISQAEELSKKLKIPLSVAKLLLSLDINNPTDAVSFLKPNLNQLHNPFLMSDMQKAVDRINQAIDNGEKILGHGDYDCDGVTTTTLMKEGFRILGVEIDVFAPNRFKDGYGLNPKRIDGFAREYDLIISGDTGIRAFDAATLVNEIGHADLIVTDHHEPLEGELYDLFDRVSEQLTDNEKLNFELMEQEDKINLIKEKGIIPKNSVVEIHGEHFTALPEAFAVVDQHRLGDDYPNKALAGVGVIFKLMQGLFMSRKQNMKPLLYLLDLVATGSIADLAQQIDRKTGKMDFENRVLSKYGIAVMNQSPKPWVKAISLSTGIKKISEEQKESLKTTKLSLKEKYKDEENGSEIVSEEMAKIREEYEMSYLNDNPFFNDKEKIDSVAIGFRIGPTLNAPGRLLDPMPAVDLLLEKDDTEALKKAKQLKKVNTKRQEQTKEYEQMIAYLDGQPEEYRDFGIVVQSDEFHIGIAGLVAGKLQQHYYRPTIALAPVEKEGKLVLKGSARSIPGIHILKCLDYVREKIGPYEYGGHEQAAGLALEPHRFEEFRIAFREACMRFDEKVFTPCMYYDAELELNEVTDKLIEAISLFEPFGEGMFKSDTKKPLFRCNHLQIKELREIMDGKGCILTFEQNYFKLKGVSFKNGEVYIPSYYQKLEESNSCVVDVLFSPEFNYWNGKRYVQMMIEDIKFL